jgi:hypothetical protein
VDLLPRGHFGCETVRTWSVNTFQKQYYAKHCAPHEQALLLLAGDQSMHISRAYLSTNRNVLSNLATTPTATVMSARSFPLCYVASHYKIKVEASQSRNDWNLTD